MCAHRILFLCRERREMIDIERSDFLPMGAPLFIYVWGWGGWDILNFKLRAVTRFLSKISKF